MSEVVTQQSSKYRTPAMGWRAFSVVFTIGGLFLALLYVFHLRPFGFLLVDITYLYYLVIVFLPLLFVYLPLNKRAPRDRVPWYDVILIVLSIAAPLYFVTKEWEVLTLGWETGAPPVAFTFSVILWALIIEAGRRAAGPSFAIIILVFSTYPLISGHMPGFLWNPSTSLHHLSSYHSFSEESIMGIPLHVFGRLFFGFMSFAIILQRLAAGKFFNDMALALVGKTRSGNAKVAIIASGLFASISGAPIANVMTTGAFTIPAMKREGLPGYFAGAVEACASSGGALMPPVMGVVAFIMAEFLEVPYSQVCLVAVVPITLYFVCLFSQIDAYAARIGLQPKPITVEVPPVWRTLVNNLHILLSFGVLVYLLFFLRLAAQGAWIATGVAILVAQFRKETRLDLKGVFLMFEDVGRILGELMGIMGPVGMIIGSFIITGVAFSLPHQIVSLAGGNIAAMLLLGAIASFILGMGVTISACYIFLAIVLAPGLVEYGFDLFGVHLFILYCGMMSYITPPVALSAFAAATISGASPMKTGVQAMKLGIAKYILPFIFITSPALILRAPAGECVHVILTCAVGLVIISGGLEGYFWGMGNLKIVTRVLLLLGGLLVAIPTLSTDLIGGAIFLATFIVGFLLRKHENFLARPAPASKYAPASA